MSFRLIKTEKSNNILNIILNDEKHQNTLSEEMIKKTEYLSYEKVDKLLQMHFSKKKDYG